MDVYWQRADRISVEQLGLLRQVEEDSRICPIPFLPESRTEGKIRGTLMHLAGYAVIDRHAISGATFAVPGQQPLQHRIPLPYVKVAPATTVSDVNWAQIFANYDYIWIYHANPGILDFLNAMPIYGDKPAKGDCTASVSAPSGRRPTETDDRTGHRGPDLQ